nr:uncharacterized protein LOC112274172 [Physcomitrium patens]|eukprot:XP_024359179.1 uncharacterized protein LOC112274172 [Physcomitrella patens]
MTIPVIWSPVDLQRAFESGGDCASPHYLGFVDGPGVWWWPPQLVALRGVPRRREISLWDLYVGGERFTNTWLGTVGGCGVLVRCTVHSGCCIRVSCRAVVSSPRGLRSMSVVWKVISCLHD